MGRKATDTQVERGSVRRSTEITDEAKLLELAAAEAFQCQDAQLVLRALRTSVAHRQAEGENVTHRVARLLLGQHADAPVIAAILLVPAAAKGIITIERIDAEYGVEVARLVAHTVRMSPLIEATGVSQHAQEAEVLRSTILDVRLLVARVATRIIELELQSFRSDRELHKLAWEGRELLVPLADRIGLGIMRGRLEDACFKVLEPQTYESVRAVAERVREADELCLELLSEKVATLLAHNGIVADVQARTKSLWGLYRKTIRYQLPVENIMDRLGARVIVSSVPECYTVLGILHRHFRPIPSTFYDYIGLPKENGYQSLHSCVYPLREISAKPVEFQIRTRAMHAEAEFGAAAHWLYKSREEGDAARSRQTRWLEEVAALHATTIDHAVFVERLEHLAYEQSLIVFLRGGALVRVPAGSTAADVITQVAETPSSTSVLLINSQERPLNTPLADGDTIEWSDGGPSQGSALREGRPR
jgi:(p)ppGpp synthase/HD superfamily hydrolase